MADNDTDREEQAPPWAPSPEELEEKEIPKRRLGRTGVDVTILGLGGEGVLRTTGYAKAATEVINTAIDRGINYLETARAYQDSESYYGRVFKERPGIREKVFVAGKSHARDREGARAHLETTLENLNTDYLDLWQVHDVRTDGDVERIFGPDGAMEAFVEAREKGLVRFLGVTGHQEPAVVKKCLETFDFDTVLVPVNPAEPHYKCFLDEIVPVASAKDLGIIGMKVYMKNLFNAPKKVLFCYALTQPIATATIGMDDVAQVRENVDVAKEFITMRYKEVVRVNEFIAPYARDLMFYKP